MEIDVEKPYAKDILTIPLDEAVKRYQLDIADIAKLKEGGVVWYEDIALTKHEEE